MEQPTIEELRTALKKYVESGLTAFVFLFPGAKAGFHEFFYDLREEQEPGNNPYIQKYIERRPGLGLVMGKGDQDYVALDFDNPALYERWKAVNPDLAQTATSRTQQGFHVLFKVNPIWGSMANGIGPITIIANGWHIAVWPTYHPSGQRYEWITPPWHGIVEINRGGFEELGLVKVGIRETDFEWEPDEYDEPQGEWYCEECMQVGRCVCGVNAWRWRWA